MGMGSATGGGSPSSPGGKGGSSSTSYPGSSSPMVAEEYPPSSPGGKGGGPDPEAIRRSSPGGKGGSPNSPGGKGGSPNSPGGKGGMPNQLPGPQQQQQPNPYQQPYQQQFMPPPQQQFSMPSPQQQQQQRLYDLMRGIDTTNLGQQQQTQRPLGYDEIGVGTGGRPAPAMTEGQFRNHLQQAGLSPTADQLMGNMQEQMQRQMENIRPAQQTQQQTGIPDFARSYASNALQAAGNMPPQGYGGAGAAGQQLMGLGQLMGGPMGGLLNRPHQGPGPGQFGYGEGTGGAPQMSQQQQQMLRDRVGQLQQQPSPQRRTTPAPQRQGGLGAAIQRQPSFRPQQMQQDPFQNSIRNQQLALQQQAMRASQQQRTQANTASAARQQAVQRAAQQAAQQPAWQPYDTQMYQG